MRESTTLHLPPTAGPDRGWEASYPGRTDQVRHVRAAVRDYLRDCPASDEVVLLVDELCANAVQFSGSGRPGGNFAVRVQYVAGRYVRAEVRDQGGDGWDGDLAGSARHPHGLYLLLRLASDCGVIGDGDGRTVWFRIGLGDGDE
jgi:serine/threonine-protein kinase RsbW